MTTQVPGDIGGDSNEFKYAASPDPANFMINSKPGELGGVRGASVVDADSSRDTAWETTTGRPDVAISVLDSGIEWDNAGAMNNLRFKIRLDQAELPVPAHDRTTALLAGADCGTFADAYDANGDHVFNIADYACDSRVDVTDPRRDGPAGTLTPQDVLIPSRTEPTPTATATSTTSSAGTSSTTTTTRSTTSPTGTAPARQRGRPPRPTTAARWAPARTASWSRSASATASSPT